MDDKNVGTIDQVVGAEKKTAPHPLSYRIEEAVTTVRLEAERRDLGEGTVVISAERLRQIMRLIFLE